jgi:hypothetical protein
MSTVIRPGSDADPFRYGWRYRVGTRPDGLNLCLALEAETRARREAQERAAVERAKARRAAEEWAAAEQTRAQAKANAGRTAKEPEGGAHESG